MNTQRETRPNGRRGTRLDRRALLKLSGVGAGLAAAEIAPRIQAVATVSMYDIGHSKRQGLAAELDEGALRKSLADVAAQRWAEVDGAERTFVIGAPQALTAASTAIDREFYDYYRTPRGDLYDRMNLIPWDTLTSFFTRALAAKES